MNSIQVTSRSNEFYFTRCVIIDNYSDKNEKYSVIVQDHKADRCVSIYYEYDDNNSILNALFVQFAIFIQKIQQSDKIILQ